tara:strand:+ start:2241 stop:3125 length:885 start_codon:yes stop_codon:yes gene_type:complete
MSLMSGKFLRGVATGAGKRMLYRMEQNRSIGEKGLETLAQANEIVKKEVTDAKKIYDTALQVGGNVGGGTFANYIFATEDIEYIAALQSMTPEKRNEAFATLKENFKKETVESQESYSDYTKVAQDKFASSVNQSKIDNGLKIKSNIPEGTTNFLTKAMYSFPKDIQKRQQQIVDEFDPPELTEPNEIKSGYESITRIPLNVKITQNDILGYLKNTIETLGFDDSAKSFKNDYDILINPNSSVVDRTVILNKYYNTVLENKIPITPVTMTGSQDETSSQALLEDETPPYEEKNT